MEIFLFLSGMFFGFLIINFFKIVLITNAFLNAERQLLFMAMNLIQFKYHAIGIIEIVYNRASEESPEYLKEKDEVIAKIHEKFNHFGNMWVESVKNNLPHQTKYNNWAQAIEYAEKLFIKNKQ